MSWSLDRLGDLAETHLGKRLHRAGNKGEYYPYLGNDNIQWGELKLDEIKEIRLTSEELERFRVRHGDLLVCEGGDPGRCAIWDQDGEMYFQMALHRVRPDEEKLDARWLKYYLMSLKLTGALDQYITARTTIKHIPQPALRAMPIRHPDVTVQRRIASILMAYDNLIENNRRQIALLEEAAQRLYREWFVDLRFPGHESIEVVDGLPVGWTNRELDAVVYQSGNAEKKSNRENYSHYLPIDSIPSKSITCWDSDAIENASSSLVAFRRDEFIFGAMRPYFHKVIVAPYAGLTRTTCFVLNASDPDYWAYAFAVLTYGDFVRYATSISVGTTMPYVRWEDLRHMPIVVPTKELAVAFKSYFTSIRVRVEALYKQIAEAREARDRLLPKLMSGEIEVEG